MAAPGNPRPSFATSAEMGQILRVAPQYIEIGIETGIGIEIDITSVRCRFDRPWTGMFCGEDTLRENPNFPVKMPLVGPGVGRHFICRLKVGDKYGGV